MRVDSVRLPTALGGAAPHRALGGEERVGRGRTAVGDREGGPVFLQSLKANSRHPSSGLLALFGFPSSAPSGKSASHSRILGGAGRRRHAALPPSWPRPPPSRQAVCRGSTEAWPAAACSSFEQTELNEFHLRRPNQTENSAFFASSPWPRPPARGKAAPSLLVRNRPAPARKRRHCAPRPAGQWAPAEGVARLCSRLLAPRWPASRRTSTAWGVRRASAPRWGPASAAPHLLSPGGTSG